MLFDEERMKSTHNPQRIETLENSNKKITDVSLDPQDWSAIRTQGHRMLDDMLDYLETLRSRPVWQPIPESARSVFQQAVPAQPTNLAQLHETFMSQILPYAVGNAHPGFMGWVHGGGTAVGMLADMLAAGLNANLGGRDQIPIEVERQIVAWVREWFGFPEGANGLFVTGTSMANLISVLVARTRLLGTTVRREGLVEQKRLVAYAAVGVHNSVAQALEIAGFGSNALRIIAVNRQHQLDVTTLRATIKRDREAGYTPFFVVGTAGSVNVGAIDNLTALADVAAEEELWFHVDGAYGALGILAHDIAPRLKGIERADSIAFDFHKWGQVPYDAGFVLIRDGELQHQTFSSQTDYLSRNEHGLAAGSPWPCDLGPDLSRGFRALKTWFTLMAYGTEQLGSMISGTCSLARYLAQRITQLPQLELLQPVMLNIVCFRYRGEDADRLNADIVIALQESGIAAPSTTVIGGQLAIRVAIVNHRTSAEDLDAMLEAVLDLGATMNDQRSVINATGR